MIQVFKFKEVDEVIYLYSCVDSPGTILFVSVYIRRHRLFRHRPHESVKNVAWGYHSAQVPELVAYKREAHTVSLHDIESVINAHCLGEISGFAHDLLKRKIIPVKRQHKLLERDSSAYGILRFVAKHGIIGVQLLRQAFSDIIGIHVESQRQNIHLRGHYRRYSQVSQHKGAFHNILLNLTEFSGIRSVLNQRLYLVFSHIVLFIVKTYDTGDKRC